MKRAFLIRTSLAMCIVSAGACDGFSGTGGSGGTASTANGDTASGTTNGPSGSTGSKDATGSGMPTSSSGSETGASTGTGGMAPTMETITVVDPSGAGVASARLVINDAAGVVVLDATAGADGSLVTDVPDGGSATYIAPPDAEGDLWMYAVLDVPSGGAMRIRAIDTATPSVNMHTPVGYSVAAANPPMSATGYQAYLTCLRPGFPAAISMFSITNYRGCIGIDETSLMVVAYGANGHALAYGLNPGIPVPATGSISQTVAMNQTMFEAKSWSVTGLDDGGPTYRLRAVGDDDAAAALVGLPLFNYETSSPSAAALVGFVDFPGTLVNGRIEEEVIVAPDNPLVVRRRVNVLPGLVGMPTTWDTTVPSTAVTEDLFDFADPADVRVRFEVPGAGADVLYMRIEQPIDGSTDRNVVLIAPTSTAMRSVPQLPGDLADLYPDFVGSQITYFHADMPDAASYAEAVAQGVAFDESMSYQADKQVYVYQP